MKEFHQFYSFKCLTMKKNLLYISLLAVVLFPRTIFAVIPASGPGENVILFTDRSIYITGEQVRFFASLWDGDDVNRPVQSEILYCEIVTPDGNKISSNKFPVSHSSVSGCVDIPPDILTGTYYLRAYTLLMRNYGPEVFGYQQIRIVNPSRAEVLASDKDQKSDSSQFTKSSSEVTTGICSVSADKAVYASRDSIRVTVRGTDGATAKIKSVCLSVVPESAESVPLIAPLENQSHEKGNMYFAENRGLSLLGSLSYGDPEAPLKSKKVNLSIMGEGREFMAVRTDSNGRFMFALPNYFGTRDLFLCAERLPLLKDVKIRVDNDFCTSTYNLPAPAFTLSEKERQTVFNMAQNVQINSHYKPESALDSLKIKKEEKAFYGKPTAIIYLDQYIQLPTLEDYLNELPSQVKVRKHKNESYFSVIGSRDLSFYDPLVLIDWVAVDEPSKILAISPQSVSRIEIVNEIYVKGDQTYGGIISIISKKGDFAGIDLPSTGIFLNYRFLTENNCDKRISPIQSNYPQAPNTLLWKPDISLGANRTVDFSFCAPDMPGKYVVVLEWVSANGELFSESSTFEVSN